LLFARKPAPIQIAYPGYPGTSGLKTMDYFVTDAFQDLPGLTEVHYVEKLIRFSPTFRCYRPPKNAPEPNALPALTNGYITFGSIGRMEKITPGVMKLWARVLSIVPGSRLLVLTSGRSDDLADSQFRSHFARHGLAGDKIKFVGRKSTADYFRLFHRIDIVLDTFPYSGCTTTFDALFMGVPVAGIKGCRHAGRFGASILSNAGCPQLVADNQDSFLATLFELTSNFPRLSGLRRSLCKPAPRQDSTLSSERLIGQWEHFCCSLFMVGGLYGR
jgi:protein O-GlcNAc transferase